MPTITTYSPLGGALEGIGSYLGQRNENAEKARALALQAAKDAQQQANLDREFREKSSEWQQDHDLNKQRTEADIAHTQNVDAISAKVEARAAELQPLLKAKMVLDNKVAAGEISLNAAKLTAQKIENQMNAAKAKVEPQLLQAALAKARADAHNEVLRGPQIQAETAAAKASANASNASAEHMRAMTPIEVMEGRARAAALQSGGGSGAGFGGGRKGGLDAGAIRNSLSADGQKFFDMAIGEGPGAQLSSPRDIANALAQSRLPAKDKQTLLHAISTPAFRTAFLETSNQGAGRAERASNRADYLNRRGGMDTWTAIAGTPVSPLAKLAPAQTAKLKGLVLGHGLDYQKLEAGLQQIAGYPAGKVDASGLTAADATQMLQLLQSPP